MKYLLFVLILLSVSCAGDVHNVDETGVIVHFRTFSLVYIEDPKAGICWAGFNGYDLEPLDCSVINRIK